MPVLNAEYSEEHGGTKNHTHHTPAVEGVQQAHHAVLVIKGTGLDNGADEHLDQSCAHGVKHHSDQDTGEGVGQHFRQHSQQRQTHGGQHLRADHAGTVADPVYELGGGKVDQQLRQEERHGDQGDLLQRDAVSVLEGQEQKRRKVGGDGLGDEPQVAGQQGFTVFRLGSHGYSFRGSLFEPFVGSAGRISVMLAELTAEVIHRVEAAGMADFLQGAGRIMQHAMRLLQTVLDQRIHRRTAHVGLKASPGLAAADAGSPGDIS